VLVHLEGKTDGKTSKTSIFGYFKWLMNENLAH